MKNFIRITQFFLFGLIVTTACQSSKKIVDKMPEAVIEDHASTAYHFKEGSFYTFDFSNSTTEGFNEKALIEKIIESRIPITDIWAKNGASGCRPPGSDLVMTVMVDPAFLLRLNKNDERLSALGFVKTDEPGTGDCAYTVRHYRFE
jgi:hypothetical protein